MIDLTARIPSTHGTLHPSEFDLAGISVNARLDAALETVFEGLVRRSEPSHDYVAPGFFTERLERVKYEGNEPANFAKDFPLALEEFERLAPSATVTSLEMSLVPLAPGSNESQSRLSEAAVTVVTRKVW